MSRAEELSFPPLTRQAVIDCAFPEWYPRLKQHSPRATVIPLPPDFLTYLEADGIFVPEGSDFDTTPRADFDADGSDIDELERQYRFPELDARIREVIERYDHAVFPKLNWSSPQDAAWINTSQTLLCRSPADVYMLLKASDFIAHDLDHAFDDCVDPSGPGRPPLTLVLKKWFEMPRSHEFRCFVRDRKLLAVTQRDVNYYHFLQDAALQDSILAKIADFLRDVVLPAFPDPHFVLDVYLTRDHSRVFIVDVNPFAPRTDAIHFDWAELLAIPSESTNPPMLRLVTSEVQASQQRPRYAHNRMPKDVVDLSDGRSIAEFAEEWRNALDEAVAAEPPSPRPAEVVERPGR